MLWLYRPLLISDRCRIYDAESVKAGGLVAIKKELKVIVL